MLCEDGIYTLTTYHNSNSFRERFRFLGGLIFRGSGDPDPIVRGVAHPNDRQSNMIGATCSHVRQLAVLVSKNAPRNMSSSFGQNKHHI